MSINAEKALNETQHPLLIKTLKNRYRKKYLCKYKLYMAKL
jgi:hypothetical protein